MYAIIKINGKQYKIFEKQKLKIEKINFPIGKLIQLNNILMISNKNKIIFLKKDIFKYQIFAKIINHIKGEKIKIIKFKRRKHYKRTLGYRKKFTLIKIKKIENN